MRRIAVRCIAVRCIAVRCTALRIPSGVAWRAPAWRVGSVARRPPRRAARLAVAAVAIGSAACATPATRTANTAPTPAARPDGTASATTRLIALPRTLAGEFDPLGVLLDLREDLALTGEQAQRLVATRRALRASNRTWLTRLDSLNESLHGRLDVWLGTARGANIPIRQRGWLPKVPPAAHELATHLLGCVRENTRDAAHAAERSLTEEQRRTLDRLARKHRDATVFLDTAHRDAAELTASPAPRTPLNTALNTPISTPCGP